jgi:hypothetical protein
MKIVIGMLHSRVLEAAALQTCRRFEMKNDKCQMINGKSSFFFQLE